MQNVVGKVFATGEGNTKDIFDCYGIDIALLNIFEITRGDNNLSKSFRTNLAMSSFQNGTKPMERILFNDFRRRMNTEVYSTETKLKVVEKNNRFRLKGYFVRPIEYSAGKPFLFEY